MARDATEVSAALFEHLLKPLVLGGKVQLERPLGKGLTAAVAALHEHASAADLAEVEFARVRKVRSLVALDRCPAPSSAEWYMLGVLHDMLQITHPGLSERARSKLSEDVCERLRSIPPIANVHEALMRHSMFARVLEITRADTHVDYWVGKATYVGTPVPARMTAWPNLRKVKTHVTQHSVAELLQEASATEALQLFLAATPLTDFATCTRTSPAFQWSDGTSALVESPAGLKVALRAIHMGEPEQIEATLVRAAGAIHTARHAAASAALAKAGLRA